MVVTQCENCGVEIRTFPSRLARGSGKYCSRACQYAAKRGRPSYERTPEHRAKMRARFIGRPAIPHAVAAAAAARRGVPPPAEVIEVRRERWTGEGNPKWSGGISRARYGAGFFSRELRAQVIARDRACVDCGNWDDWPRAMHLHHIDGGKTDHSLDNLVLLCRPCHVLRHTEERRRARREAT